MTERPASPPHIAAEWDALNVEERADVLAWAADTANVDMTDDATEPPVLFLERVKTHLLLNAISDVFASDDESDEEGADQ